MKKICLLLMLNFSALLLYAQKQEQPNRPDGKIDYEGYTITPTKTQDGQLGYLVHKDNKLIAAQVPNAGFSFPTPPRNEKELLKIAQLHVKQLKEGKTATNTPAKKERKLTDLK
jgi:hypothetical protein